MSQEELLLRLTRLLDIVGIAFMVVGSHSSSVHSSPSSGGGMVTSTTASALPASHQTRALSVGSSPRTVRQQRRYSRTRASARSRSVWKVGPGSLFSGRASVSVGHFDHYTPVPMGAPTAHERHGAGAKRGGTPSIGEPTRSLKPGRASSANTRGIPDGERRHEAMYRAC
jgi:hypothetical protein